MRLSTDDLAFLARLSKSPDGRRLLQLLQAKQTECNDKLRSTTGEEVLRWQGRALAVDELIADIAQAEQKLTRNGAPVTSQARPVPHQQ
ncbi:MAG: hypothetical protein JSR30_13170 [Proteobacteria bacterium]|jgi:hypothetical protein|nr:hypothetical protein [Pseudomonadota bacterium]